MRNYVLIAGVLGGALYAIEGGGLSFGTTATAGPSQDGVEEAINIQDEIASAQEMMQKQMQRLTALTQSQAQKAQMTAASMTPYSVYLPQDVAGWTALPWSDTYAGLLEGERPITPALIAALPVAPSASDTAPTSFLYLKPGTAVHLEIAEVSAEQGSSSAHLVALRKGFEAASASAYARIRGVDFRLKSQYGAQVTIQARLADKININAVAHGSGEDVRSLLSHINLSALMRQIERDTGHSAKKMTKRLPQTGTRTRSDRRHVVAAPDPAKDETAGIMINRGTTHRCSDFDASCTLLKR